MTHFRRTSRLAAGLGIASGTVLLLAGPAAALHGGQARASAASVELLGASVVDTGEVVATNDGTNAPTVTGAPTTTILSGQTLLTAGVLAQDASAVPLGSSTACAGAVGQGGIIQVGPGGGCVAAIGQPAGVTVNLNTLATLRANAIYAECTDTDATAPTGRATLAEAQVFLLGALTPITVDGGTAVNQGLNVPGIATIITNEQISNADGSLTVRALRITLLPNVVTGNPAAEIIIGEVTCGIPVPDISIFGGPAIPAAAVGAAVVGTVFFVRRRRQTA